MAIEKNNQDDQATMEMIDRYLFDELNQEERLVFMDGLKSDPDFRKKIMEQKQQMEAVEEYNLRESLNNYHNELTHEGKSTNHDLKWMAIAASVLLLLGYSIYTFTNRISPAERVFAKNFRPDPGLPTTMGKNTDYEFYSGMVSYKQEKYSEAISLWQPLYTTNASNDTITYFLGVAYLADENIPQAEKYFEHSAKIKNNAFKSETDYYLALTYLKQNKIKEAKDILRYTDDPNNRHLLQQIDKLE